MITVKTIITAPIETVWQCWIDPAHITKWNQASDDWYTPRAENDLRPGGTFCTRMEAKDGSAGFDFAGTYTAIQKHELIEYVMSDGRRVAVRFAETPEGVEVIEQFDPESENSEEVQRAGWQAILDSFKQYVESFNS